ncbi:MAG: acyltransferase [Alloprevotella sp.]
MRTSIQYINKLIFPLLPETRCFWLKRFLLRLSGAKIGDGVRVCSSASIIGAGTLEIGENTWVGQRVLIVASSNIKIGKNVDIAPNVYIGNGTHEITIGAVRIAEVEVSKDICIGDGCWLCVNSVLLGGVSIGNKCVVAAGTVVTKSFSDQRLIVGVPAIEKKVLSE